MTERKPAGKPKKFKIRRSRGDVFEVVLDGEKDITVRKGDGHQRVVVTVTPKGDIDKSERVGDNTSHN